MVNDGILSNFVKIYRIKSFQQLVNKMLLPMKKKFLNIIGDPKDLEFLKMTDFTDEITDEILI